jgi:hypothetical protein
VQIREKHIGRKGGKGDESVPKILGIAFASTVAADKGPRGLQDGRPGSVQADIAHTLTRAARPE